MVASPVADSSQPLPSARNAPLERGGPPRIFVADDAEDDLALTLRFLRKAVPGAEVETLEDGLAAYERLRDVLEKGPLPSLVILDLKMPRMSGREIVEAVADLPNFPYVPLVLFTSSTENQDIVASYRAGARSFVHKPVDYDLYRQAISEICRYWLGTNALPDGQ